MKNQNFYMRVISLLLVVLAVLFYNSSMKAQANRTTSSTAVITSVKPPVRISAYLSQAESVIDSILSAQSTDVDTVSGATFSSTGILNAVDDALGKAENS